MPHAELPGAKQRQNRHRTHSRKSVTDKHEFLFVKPVCQRTRKNAHENIGCVGTDCQRRRTQRGTGLFIQPQCQGIRRHGTAKLGNTLGAPQNQKIF